jgi:hypothetical protein
VLCCNEPRSKAAASEPELHDAGKAGNAGNALVSLSVALSCKYKPSQSSNYSREHSYSLSKAWDRIVSDVPFFNRIPTSICDMKRTLLIEDSIGLRYIKSMHFY